LIATKIARSDASLTPTSPDPEHSPNPEHSPDVATRVFVRMIGAR
jgi:hypothetical protein